MEKHPLVRQGIFKNESVRGHRSFTLDAEVDRPFDLLMAAGVW